MQTATPAAHAPPRPPALSSNYLNVPVQLLADLRDTPLAVALWMLIARLHFISRAPVPLSDGDIARYDPSLKAGAIQRACDRLAQHGYVTPTRQHGQKNRYVPTWGQANGQALPWRFDAPLLGRPARLRAPRLDRNLLDVYIGRLEPHAQHAATVTRMVSAPLLGLRDIGAYALLAGGYGAATPALRHWGLVRHAHVQPVPNEGAILALASQQPLNDAAQPGLSAHGYRRLAGIGTPPAPPAGQPLFFVAPDLIGGACGSLIGAAIGSLIGSEPPPHPAPTAPASPKSPREHTPHNAAGSHRDQGIIANQGNDSPTSQGGGVNLSVSKRNLPPHQREEAAPPQTRSTPTPMTPAAMCLRRLNARPEVVAELADVPLAVVEAALRDAQQRDGVRDQTAWVVAMVRAARNDGWRIPEAAPRDTGTNWRALQARYVAEGLISADAGAGAELCGAAPPAPVPEVPAQPAPAAALACDAPTSDASDDAAIIALVVAWLRPLLGAHAAWLTLGRLAATPAGLVITCPHTAALRQLLAHLPALRALVRANGYHQPLHARVGANDQRASSVT